MNTEKPEVFLYFLINASPLYRSLVKFAVACNLPVDVICQVTQKLFLVRNLANVGTLCIKRRWGNLTETVVTFCIKERS